MLIPRGIPEWQGIRLFSTFSSLEQVMKKEGIGFGVAFEGLDELLPVYVYRLHHGIIHREVIRSP